MPYKLFTKWIIISLSCTLLNACINTQYFTNTVSSAENAALHLKLGVRYLDLGMLEIAKENLDRSLYFDSDNAAIHNSLAVLYERLKQFKKARKSYQQAIDIEDQDIGINNNYGRFLCDRGDYQAGIQFLKRALNNPLNNRQWFAYTNMGRCELMQGQQQKAENYFRQALLKHKSYPPVLLEMQKISYYLGKYLSSRAFLERYLAVAQHNPETLWFAIQTERVLGNKQQSEEYLEKLFKQFPTSKEAIQLKTDISTR